MAKFIIDTTDNNISRSMLEMILEEHLDYNVYVKEVKPIDNNKLNELAEEMSKGFWSDDLESFEDNPQRDLIIWAAQRIYECGIKNGYKKAKSE